MKPLRAQPHVPRHSLLHPDRVYVPAAQTDIAKTFARIRREQAEIAKAAQEQAARDNVRTITRKERKA